MCFEKIMQADVGIDRDVGVIIEIFPVGETVIRLQQRQRALRGKFGSQLRKECRELVFSYMLSYIAWKGVVNRVVRDIGKFVQRTGDAFDTRCNEPGEFRPAI